MLGGNKECKVLIVTGASENEIKVGVVVHFRAFRLNSCPSGFLVHVCQPSLLPPPQVGSTLIADFLFGFCHLPSSSSPTRMSLGECAPVLKEGMRSPTEGVAQTHRVQRPSVWAFAPGARSQTSSTDFKRLFPRCDGSVRFLLVNNRLQCIFICLPNRTGFLDGELQGSCKFCGLACGVRGSRSMCCAQ